MKNLLLLLALAGVTYGCKKSDDSPSDAVVEAPAEAGTSGEAEADSDDAQAVATPDEEIIDDANEATSDAAAAPDSLAMLDDLEIATDIQVTSKGAAPHRQLRYDLDALKDVVGESVTELTSTAMGQEMVLPRILGTLRFTDVKLESDKLHYTLVVDEQRYEARAGDPIHQAMLESMRAAPQQTVRASVVMNPDSSIHSIDLSQHAGDPDTALETVSASLQNMASNFPQEPVGVGATWTTTTHMAFGPGVRASIVVESKLNRFTDNGVEIESSFSAPDLASLMEEQARAAGEDVKISKSDLRGKGVAVIPFDTLVPTMEQEITMELMIEAEGQAIDSRMDLKMTLRAVD